MTNSSVAEVYFIAGMMVLILVISIPATYLFFRQYYREKAANKESAAAQKEKPESQ